MATLGRQIEALTEENARLRADNSALQAEIERLKADLETAGRKLKVEQGTVAFAAKMIAQTTPAQSKTPHWDKYRSLDPVKRSFYWNEHEADLKAEAKLMMKDV